MGALKKHGRTIEAEKIRRANRAAAVGRLMLGEFNNWVDFLKADSDELESLPRRQLKSAVADIKKRMSGEIKNFCVRNFENLTVDDLDRLYEEIKAFKGLEIPLKDFEDKYSKIHPTTLKGYPSHSTVVISLWGLQFKFPEDFLAKDLHKALSAVISSHEELEKYQKSSQRKLAEDKEGISDIIRKESYSSRSVIICCFNLVEAYLNGIAWQFSEYDENCGFLSNRQQTLIKDIGQTTIRDKIIKYPKIVTGKELWNEDDDLVSSFLEIIKPFRDSLVHPSPFSAPDKFGGYDKLSKFYRINADIAIVTAKTTSMIIKEIHQHVTTSKNKWPVWMDEIESLLDEVVQVVP